MPSCCLQAIQLIQQEYDFDYDDDDDAEMDDAGGDIENQYYKAKCKLNVSIGESVTDDQH